MLVQASLARVRGLEETTIGTGDECIDNDLIPFCCCMLKLCRCCIRCGPASYSRLRRAQRARSLRIMLSSVRNRLNHGGCPPADLPKFSLRARLLLALRTHTLLASWLR